ncbi:MAG: hypothetical protein AAF533_26245, partial [Acidobacteriota bacterium]
ADPRRRIAGTLLAEIGLRQRAAGMYLAAEELHDDCLLQVRMAELELGPGCPDHPTAALREEPDRQPWVAGTILAPRSSSRPSAFFASGLATALKILAPDGEARVESTADRFRITGKTRLAGIAYLEDRLLILAAPAPGVPAELARHSLRQFLRSWDPSPDATGPLIVRSRGTDEPAATAVPAPRTTSLPTPPAAPAERISGRHFGLLVTLPADWAKRSETSKEIGFGPTDGQVLYRLVRKEQGARRSVGRRRDAGYLMLFPPGSKITQVRTTSLPDQAGSLRLLDWRDENGTERSTLLRELRRDDGSVLAALALGVPPTGIDVGEATRLLSRISVGGSR